VSDRLAKLAEKRRELDAESVGENNERPKSRRKKESVESSNIQSRRTQSRRVKSRSNESRRLDHE
jgi:hypothetical protein